MAASTVPALRRATRAALMAAMPAVNVIAGPQLSDDPTDALLIGVRDPFAFLPPPSITTTQEVATMGTNRSRDEEVTLWLTVLVRSGSVDVEGMYDQAFGHVAEVESWARGLNVPILDVAGVYRVDVGGMECSDDLDDAGSWVSVSFPLIFRSRI